MRSDVVKKGPERAPHRSLLYALGLTTHEIEQPFVGVINAYSEIIPGHIHLRQVAEAVKAGVRMAGGTPFEVNTIGVCDGIAMNHSGMKFSLASRELIADSVEVVVQAHAFDALVLTPSCDKIVPGMLMAAARLNIPTIMVSGGPMMAGRIGEEALDLGSVFQSVGAVAQGGMDEAELYAIERAACPGCGSCAGMFTANTMCCLSEALGMSLPGNGTIPAVYAARLALAKKAGMQIMRLLEEDIKPLDIITAAALKNAFTADMALGGSTNSVLHLLAIAHEAGVKFSLTQVNECNARTPQLCKLSPAGAHHIEDLHLDGGIPVVMRELAELGLLEMDALTVTGETMGGNLKQAPRASGRVIRLGESPYAPTGGLVVLFGNLAPGGAVVKRSAVAPEMLEHRGPARVFESEEEATDALMKGDFSVGDVLVIRNEGPKGGPGMREMLTPTSLVTGMGMDDKVVLLTDGRFSGATRGSAIGHISPEAAEGGLLAIVRDGDIVHVDIPRGTLDLEVPAEEIERRQSELPPWEPRVRSGYLKRYASLVTSAGTGAVFRD